jgi:hypothetical protein
MHNFDNVIDIKANNLGDTRTANRKPYFKEFQDANRCHMNDVQYVMHEIAKLIRRAGNDHDYTKELYESEFYVDFCKVLDGSTEKFTDMEWYQTHIREERHHINSRCPDDVDLIDIIEHIVDCCCAGKTRSGYISPVVIDPEILKKAVETTVKLIDNNTRIVE